MNQTEFLTKLKRTANTYDWDYVDNQLVGVAKRGKDSGKRFNPITAVARSFQVGTYNANKRDTYRAARKLGLTESLVDAVLSDSNRGHAQIVRGKMLEVLNNEK